MKEKTAKILGVNFTYKNFKEMLQVISSRINKQQKAFIVTANPEIVMYANRHKDYSEIISSADYIVPDGIGVVIASKILQEPLDGRVTGYDLMMSLLKLANENCWSVYLLGGQPEVNLEASLKVKENYPRIELVGSHHGYFDFEDNKIAEEIKRLKPDLVFVALGFPRQEKWIGKYFKSFEKGVFIGVGGSIDVLSGRIKRAPLMWQKTNLEWLYRLIKQPSRWKRMLELPKFIIKVVSFKLFKSDS
ncbi:WecB/TagA/CpsF family glycosyltransferase [Bacillaceae bacterium CLA-AA-H227]|uniref:WecB/TagA/CpsF family glycosyltransferase n=1 Tax=Robertmurraya yapensis (ex Hitch et al 2024) TaxID=3133160 RepID=A0ACC6SBX1_9BACI